MIVALILISGPISGGSFNPARSLAPALVSGKLTALGMYMIAPVVGAVLAVLGWKTVFAK